MKRLLQILTFLLFVGILPLEGQDIESRNAEKKKIEAEISFIDKQLKGLNLKQKKTTKNLVLIQKRAAGRKKMINSLNAEIGRLDETISSKQTEIDSLREKLDTLEQWFGKFVYNAYKNRSPKVWYMYILGSENIGQGYRRLMYLKNLSKTVNRQGDRIKEFQQRIAEEKGELETRKQEASALRGKREKEYSKLLKEEKESKSLINGINKDKKKYQKELARKRKEVAALNREIEKILKASVKKDMKTKMSAAQTALSGEFAQNRGKLGWPVAQGVITERFGVHYHPVFKNLKLPENNGITISTDKNAKVMCVFNGVVKQIIMMPGYNHCVLVQHGEYYTFYCKLREVKVKTGQQVTTGQILGTLEASEDNASLLHFQIWEGTVKQNPETWLK